MRRRDVERFDLLNQHLCDQLNEMKFVIKVKTSLISREQRDVARPHGCQEGFLAIVQPLNGAGLPAMTHCLFCGTDYLQSGVRINGSTTRGSCRTKRDPDTVRRKAKARLATAKPGTTRIGRRGWRKGGGRGKRSVEDTSRWLGQSIVFGSELPSLGGARRILWKRFQNQSPRTPVFRCLNPGHGSSFV
jgi:hypothetical protein